MTINVEFKTSTFGYYSILIQMCVLLWRHGYRTHRCVYCYGDMVKGHTDVCIVMGTWLQDTTLTLCRT